MSQTANQQLILPDDANNANVPLTFTNFVTTAVFGMENKLVQRFLSAVDRTARNPAPNAGELSFLADTASFEWFNGVAWVALTKGYVTDATRIVNTAGFTIVETVTDTVTFTAIAGLRYKLTFYGSVQSTAANDLVQVRFRYLAGGVLTAAGTQFASTVINCDVAGRGSFFSLSKTVTGIAAGTTTIGVTMIRNAGAGTITSAGAVAQENNVLLEID